MQQEIETKCYYKTAFLKNIISKSISPKTEPIGIGSESITLFFYFLYFDMEINALSDSKVWGLIFLSAHLKLDTQTSL